MSFSLSRAIAAVLLVACHPTKQTERSASTRTTVPRSPAIEKTSSVPPATTPGLAPRVTVTAPTAGASAQDAAPQFSTRTVSHDPKLRKQLDAGSRLPAYFSSRPELREQYAPAQALVSAVGVNLEAGTWHVEIRTGCPPEHDGDVLVAARATVRDQAGQVRALSQAAGTGDSAGIWKLYYDTGRLRAVVFDWRNYRGETANGVALFDESGSLEACSGLPNDASLIFCEGRGALGEEMGREYFSLRPDAAIEACDTPYRPSK